MKVNTKQTRKNCKFHLHNYMYYLLYYVNTVRTHTKRVYNIISSAECDISERSGNPLSTNAKWFREDIIYSRRYVIRIRILSSPFTLFTVKDLFPFSF